MFENRKIIHIDMDAFFTSIEQRDFPELKNKPIVVSWDTDRSVVAAASYEARKFGIFSAMSLKVAKKKVKNLIVVKPRFHEYKSVSEKVLDIFTKYTSLVEPLSLDEAYLDVTENNYQIPSATIIAQKIKEEIYNQTNLTCSAGISYNKFLAKIASDLNKPNGLTVITPKMSQEFIENLKIEKFPGVGKITKNSLNKLGIFYGKDLLKFSELELHQKLGKYGLSLFKMARGVHNSRVNPERDRKSIGMERTFEKDITDEIEIYEYLKNLLFQVYHKLKKNQLVCKTITIKIKYFNFEVQTISKTVKNEFNKLEEMNDVLNYLFINKVKIKQPIRLLGISLTNLIDEVQLNNEEKQKELNFWGRE